MELDWEFNLIESWEHLRLYQVGLPIEPWEHIRKVPLGDDLAKEVWIGY